MAQYLQVHSEQTAQIVRDHPRIIPLKPNTYDAVILSVCKLFDKSTAVGENVMPFRVNFLIAFILNVAAIVLQIVIIFMLIEFTIERKEDLFEQRLTHHTGSLKHAVEVDRALNENIKEHATALELCMQDHNVPYSQSVLVFLWGLKLLPVVSQAVWELRLVLKLPNPDSSQLIENLEEKKEEHIVGMPTWIKIFSALLVNVPRIAVAVSLYIMGAKFLMYAPSLGVLIMKSVGLAFILTIPDMLFTGLFSESFQAEVKKTRFSFMDSKNVLWNSYGSSITKFFLVISASLVYCRIICADLQAFRAACIQYKYHFIVPSCSPHCGSHLFGFTLYN